MSKTDVQKNFKLLASFSEYVAKHPETMKDVPRKSTVVLTTTSDPTLSGKNLALQRLNRKSSYRAERAGRVWKVSKLKA